MFSGYLLKRNSNAKAPAPMQRVFCVLWGTLLLDYENEDESKTQVTSRCSLEIIGVSKWDGQGRSNVYPHGFLVVTHHGGTYYLSAPTPDEKSQWIIHIRAGLESNFANTELMEYKPSKACFDVPEIQKIHPATATMTCSKTGQPLNPNTSSICKCCGQYFSFEFVQDSSSVMQIGFEEQIKICIDCKNAQACLVWLKTLLYVHTLHLHEQTEEVLVKVDRYKASFKLRRNLSQRLNMAAQLKDDGQVDEFEFESLRKIDHEYRQDALLEECDRMKLALEALGNDMQSIIGFLRNPNMTISSTRKDSRSLHSAIRLYYLVVLRLVEVSDTDPDLIDFYWPQVMQVHLLLSKTRSTVSMAMVDLLQQGILAIALRFPYLALKLSWAILASIGDYHDNKITQSQYCASVLLLLQLEVLTYGVCSCLTDIIHASQILPSSHLSQGTPRHGHGHGHAQKSVSGLGAGVGAGVGSGTGTGSVLHDLLFPAHHQKQELMLEMYTLLRIRKQVHHVNQKEEKKRRLQQLKTSTLSQYGAEDVEETAKKSSNNKDTDDQSLQQSTHESQLNQSTIDPSSLSSSSSSSSSSSASFGSMTAVGLFLTGCCDSSSSSSSSGDTSEKNFNEAFSLTTTTVMPRYSIWKGLSAQLDFTNKLTDLVDTLRFIDRPLRCDHLKAELLKSFVLSDGTLMLWGLDPTGAAGEPPYRIHKIFIEDVKVFRTKARAPSLILFEVVLDGDGSNLLPYNDQQQHQQHQHHHYLHQNQQQVMVSPQHLHNSHHSHHSLVPSGDTSADLASDAMTINHMVEERMHKTVEDMNRERLNSEHLETQNSSDDRDRDRDSKRFSKSYSTNDIPSSSSTSSGAVSSSALPSARTRKLSSSGYIHSTLPEEFNRFHFSHSPEMSGGSSGGGSGGGLGGDGELDLFQSEGLPDEDIEVTKKVITSANNLLQSGTITQEEYNQLVQSDCKYRDEAKLTDAERTKAKLQFYYGEEWNDKKDRLLGLSSSAAAAVTTADPASDSGDASAGGAGAGAAWSVTEYSNRNRSRARSRSLPDNSDLPPPSRLPSFDHSIDDSPLPSDPSLAIPLPSHSEIIITDPSSASAVASSVSAAHPGEYHLIQNWPQHDLRSFIIKSNDDLRQEVACIQLIELCQEIFHEANLDDMLWLKPYRIVSTGPSAGFVETLPNTLSIDAIKKTDGFISLPKYFDLLYGGSANRLHTARLNYVSSLAAYSLITYLLMIKDRHNGNILFDSEGHIIHIDFGFLLGIAPGGSFSVETAPFKLTHEMLEIFDGLDSYYFSLFVKAFTTGFLALRSKSTAILSAIEVMSQDSTFPCFQGKDLGSVLERLKGRFRNDLTVAETVEYCLDLIIQSYSNLGTKNYDTFQYYTNGIIP